MGSTSWSAAHYDDRVKVRLSTGAATFGFHDAIKTGAAAAGVHPSLDPKGVKLRESRDSDAHPEAVPIAVLCDVTGSMSSVPGIVQKSLKQLMSLLIRKGYADHPAILVGAIGDAYTDVAPLQVGQFESGIEIEDNLTNLYLEGNGGGQNTESYELALYFMARHTAHDHMERRGRRGYLFIVGDENPYPRVSQAQVRRVLGEHIEADVPIADILAEAQAKYEVFYILPKMTHHFDDPAIRAEWRRLLGQNLLVLDDPAGICELIAAQVGACEGKVDRDSAASDLIDAGVDHAIASSVSRALAPAGSGGALAQAIAGSGAPGGLAEF